MPTSEPAIHLLNSSGELVTACCHKALFLLPEDDRCTNNMQSTTCTEFVDYKAFVKQAMSDAMTLADEEWVRRYQSLTSPTFKVVVPITAEPFETGPGRVMELTDDTKLINSHAIIEAIRVNAEPHQVLAIFNAVMETINGKPYEAEES